MFGNYFAVGNKLAFFDGPFDEQAGHLECELKFLGRARCTEKGNVAVASRSCGDQFFCEALLSAGHLCNRRIQISGSKERLEVHRLGLLRPEHGDQRDATAS